MHLLNFNIFLEKPMPLYQNVQLKCDMVVFLLFSENFKHIGTEL